VVAKLLIATYTTSGNRRSDLYLITNQIVKQTSNKMRSFKTLYVGDQIETMCTGLRVDATITSVEEDSIHYVYHKPVQWGDNLFTKGASYASQNDVWEGKLVSHCWDIDGQQIGH